MIVAGLLAGAVLALLLSAFFSGTETGIYCLNHVRLSVRAARRDVRAVRLRLLMHRPQDLVITTLLGTNVADYLATVFVTALLLHLSVAENLAEVYATVVLTPLILVFGGVMPKDWFRRESDHLMYACATPLAWCRRVRCGAACCGCWAVSRAG